MQKWDHLQLQQFLSSHPKLRLREFTEDSVSIEGEYDIHAQMTGYQAIHETYELLIVFPRGYPRSIPTVIEQSKLIPRNSDYHTYEDGSFCLGSDIKIKLILHDTPCIADFFAKVIDPFLYAVTYKIQHNLYPFGDLDHGEKGLIDDYEDLFNVKDKKSVLIVLQALGKRKRVANKLPCPCGCGGRIGKCDYRFSLHRWRRLAKRRWFREHLSKSFSPIPVPTPKNIK